MFGYSEAQLALRQPSWLPCPPVVFGHAFQGLDWLQDGAAVVVERAAAAVAVRPPALSCERQASPKEGGTVAKPLLRAACDTAATPGAKPMGAGAVRNQRRLLSGFVQAMDCLHLA